MIPSVEKYILQILLICLLESCHLRGVNPSVFPTLDDVETSEDVADSGNHFASRLRRLEERIGMFEKTLVNGELHQKRERRDGEDLSTLPTEGKPNIQRYTSEECFFCPPGQRGPPGPPGVQGVAGRDGMNGRDGSDGRDGRDAPLEETGCKGDTATFATPPEVKPSNTSSGGTVYVRWGRRDCQETAHLVYDGITGGGKYNEGDGGNYICLPHEPIYGVTESSAHENRARIYSTELYGDGFPPFQSIHSGGDDIPCAVCRTESRSTVLMVPARNICPSDEWTLEYRGYLSAVRYDVYRTEYLCVDAEPQALPRSAGYQSGAWLHVVEARCVSGSGLCGPYVNGYELTCAVCTI